METDVRLKTTKECGGSSISTRKDKFQHEEQSKKNKEDIQSEKLWNETTDIRTHRLLTELQEVIDSAGIHMEM